MAHSCECHASSAAVLDVREVAPRIRHPRIFETFHALPAGQAFVLVNDHDPKPLFYQFQAERAGSFGWRYLEQGPDEWRVEISKPAASITANRTVAEIAHQYPAALRVMQELGINHCCGADLRLTEAAAAAGIPVQKLLEALQKVEGGPA